MVKKLKQMAGKPAGAGGVFDSVMAGSVRESAQQIWLAGMGAFAKAQQEGSKVFDALVKDGVNLQRKTQAVAGEKIGEVTSRVSNMAGEVGSKAGQHWDKLESIFEERVARSMGRLGVPTAREMAVLREQIDALSLEVARMSRLAKTASKSSATKGAAAAKKTAAQAPTKAAAKRSAAKKSSSV
ncbi:MAG: phasin family protein [Ideonella sp.]